MYFADVGAVVGRIGVLVHVHREQRNAAGRGHRIVLGAVVEQPLVARRIGQDHPAGARGQRLSDADELRLPAIEAAEVARHRLGEQARRLGRRLGEPVEIDFVQDRRIVRALLFALQFAELLGRHVREVDLRELLADRVQLLHRAGIIVVVMGAQEIGRQALDLVGIDDQRLGRHLRDGDGTCHLRRCLLGACTNRNGANQQAGARGQGAAGDVGHGGSCVVRRSNAGQGEELRRTGGTR